MNDLLYTPGDFREMLIRLFDFLMDDGWVPQVISEHQDDLIARWEQHEQDYQNEQRADRSAYA